MRILHIESDGERAEAVDRILSAEGWTGYAADRGDEGLELAKRYDFDVVLFAATPDDAPDLSCRTAATAAALRRLRRETPKPVIVLAGLEARWGDRVRLLDAGADDVLPRPFHPDELKARIRAVVRRAKGHAESRIVVGTLEVNLARRCVTLAGVPLQLTQKEYTILELMALRRDSVVSYDVLMDRLYGGRDEPEPNILKVFICKLRKKLAAAVPPGAAMGVDLATFWGRGWILREPAEPIGAALADAFAA